MKPIKHFLTITKHRHKVIACCFKVGIGFQGLFHDLSKYSFQEFWESAKYYTGTCSPNVKARQEKGYSLAWMHHKGRNKHHLEYWTDIVNGKYAPVLVPIKYLKESLCDRIAASKVYLKDKYNDSSALDYFLSSSESHLEINETTKLVLFTWLTWIKEDGQKKALKRIKGIKTYQDMSKYLEA